MPFGAALQSILPINNVGNSNIFSMVFTTALAVGNNTIRTPATGKAIRVFKIQGSLSAGATLLFTDAAGGFQFATITLAAAGPFIIDLTPDGYDLAAGNALVCNSTAIATPAFTINGREG